MPTPPIPTHHTESMPPIPTHHTEYPIHTKIVRAC